jgi:hypothetical protein
LESGNLVAVGELVHKEIKGDNLQITEIIVSTNPSSSNINVRIPVKYFESGELHFELVNVLGETLQRLNKYFNANSDVI